MVKTGDEKELSEDLVELQKEKGTYDSPCMSVCDYMGLFDQCKTCSMRKVEKKIWIGADTSMKEQILRAIKGRASKD